MPRLSRKVEIKSTPQKIYKIVTDGFNTPKWNPTVSSVVEIENKKIYLDTDLGGFTIIDTEVEQDISATWHMKSNDISSIGYILTPKKGKTTVVDIWTEFEDKKQSKIFKQMADQILVGLKNYIEFLEKGGDPKFFNKWEFLTPF
ncbi:MAG: SRPBCC family protein [Candidatus Hodarchaeota archaeon]